MSRTISEVDNNCRQPEYKTTCCPDCGALECLCRPRFFAGQLLSEQDLNRLDQYIKNKNRLHNRNQHGWGVVNGLKVLCDPCGEVKVTEGYALDPCGDDIVVCEDVRVNICELIRKCKQAEKQPDCNPFYQPPNTNCDDIEEKWVLTIKYQEQASRGVTALRGNNRNSYSCSCGAAKGITTACTCGDNVSTKPAFNNAISNRKKRGVPAECEATVICEGFSFGVYKKPLDKEDKKDDGRLVAFEGAFWETFNCCAQPLMDTIPPMPDLTNGNDNIVQLAIDVSKWCCRFRENLLNYYLTHPHTSCEVIDHLRAINCPNINSPNTFILDFIRSFLQLLEAWAEGLKNCFCLALMPGPPQVTCDTRVPLATVRIRARDCKILSICNWTSERKVMISWPAMTYWLGIVPIGDFIRELLERLCCNSLLGIFDDVIDRTKKPGNIDDDTGVGTTAGNNVETEAAAAPFNEAVDFTNSMHLASGALASRFSLNLSEKVDGISSIVDSVMKRGDTPLDLSSVLNSVSPRFKLPENNKGISDVEAKNLPFLVLSEVMVKPVLSNVLGNEQAAARIKEFQRGLYAKKTVSKKTMDDDAISEKLTREMKQQIKDMQLQMDKQEVNIQNLLSQLKK